MSRSKVSDKQKTARKEWAAFFATLLANSPARVTSSGIADAVNDEIGVSGEGRVSESLVAKWRSPGGQRLLVPKDQRTANGLARALVRLGVFDGDDPDAAAAKQRELVTRLGFAWEQDRGQEVRDRLKAATLEEISRAIIARSPKVSRGASTLINPTDVLLAAACELSQVMVQEDMRALVESGGLLVFSPLWPVMPAGRVTMEQESFHEEFLGEHTREYFREVRARSDNRVQIFVLFRIYGLEYVSGQPEWPQPTWSRLVSMIKTPPFSNDSGCSIKWRSVKDLDPQYHYHFWLHLHNVKKSVAWRLVLHRNLYETVNSSELSTMCSPAACVAPNLAEQFRTDLGVEYQPTEKANQVEWVVGQGWTDVS